MIKRILIPDILQPVSHYCHAVEANGIIWVSGLVGMNFDGTIPDNTKDQFDIAMKDLDTCLIAAGGSSKDVVKYINEISKNLTIKHIKNTSICFYKNSN